MPAKLVPTLDRRVWTRRQVISAGTITVAGLALHPWTVLADEDDEISHSAEAIHQERVFKASRKRIYGALITTKQFEQVTQLSGVMQSAAMSKMQKPTRISPDVGGAFVLFGGHIVGRNVELQPDELIVQAWRTGSWEPGIYSIARFQLKEQETGTKLIFDHTGFPKGQAAHLASGWQEHYWDPLAKFLS